MRDEIAGDRHVRGLHLLALQAEPRGITAFELAAVEDIDADRLGCCRRLLRTHARDERAQCQAGGDGGDGEDLLHDRASYTDHRPPITGGIRVRPTARTPPRALPQWLRDARPPR